MPFKRDLNGEVNCGAQIRLSHPRTVAHRRMLQTCADYVCLYVCFEINYMFHLERARTIRRCAEQGRRAAKKTIPKSLARSVKNIWHFFFCGTNETSRINNKKRLLQLISVSGSVGLMKRKHLMDVCQQQQHREKSNMVSPKTMLRILAVSLNVDAFSRLFACLPTENTAADIFYSLLNSIRFLLVASTEWNCEVSEVKNVSNTTSATANAHTQSSSLACVCVSGHRPLQCRICICCNLYSRIRSLFLAPDCSNVHGLVWCVRHAFQLARSRTRRHANLFMLITLERNPSAHLGLKCAH